MDTGRTLIFLRHGKSAYPPATSDHDRPLADRGEREAALAGDWLREHAPRIDLVLCSTSRRTRDTLAAARIDAPVTFVPELYGADEQSIIEEIGLVEPSIQAILVIGHWPGIPDATLYLAANDTGEAAGRIRAKYPTSALAVLTTKHDWDKLAAGSCTLVTFHVPR
ncbi:histidine phosphatase family protein [Hoyosella sp. G463]|uniref:Histidine phosphatase family protein n=1 Tax=Lolliginicoccus lacisalsi TaxID=2742202 RepID=A0A927PMC7_9ACTN|nr:histidine phosphatase family protein [Lolliginicoccus lacisalsi]MBD8507828.1 histidine phosphatase family protein [Lolliginicoccus lacisalsi]